MIVSQGSGSAMTTETERFLYTNELQTKELAGPQRAFGAGQSERACDAGMTARLAFRSL
jgi:hypothetical protein